MEMEKEKINRLSINLYNIHYSGMTKVPQDCKDIAHLINSFNSYYEELMEILENNDLTDKEIEDLDFVKEYENQYLKITSFESFKDEIKRLNEGVKESAKYPYTLLAIKDENKELFHQIIKEDYSLGDRDYYIKDLTNSQAHIYNELVKDSVFCDIAKQINIIKSFENGEIKLADIDDSILQNDYNMERIYKAISEKLYTAFADKIEKANTSEQEMKIKEMLDKKIESTVADLQVRRENSLQQNHNNVQEDIKKYEV